MENLDHYAPGELPVLRYKDATHPAIKLSLDDIRVAQLGAHDFSDGRGHCSLDMIVWLPVRRRSRQKGCVPFRKMRRRPHGCVNHSLRYPSILNYARGTKSVIIAVVDTCAGRGRSIAALATRHSTYVSAKGHYRTSAGGHRRR